MDLDRTFAALADPTRRRIVELLKEEPLSPSTIADALSVSRPAMSRHLRVLRRAGLVSDHSIEEDARVRMVQLEREPFGELREWLDEVEAFWADQLGAFKAHAEAKHRRRRK